MSEREVLSTARVEGWLAGLALALICLISLANVVVRYASDVSFAFTEEFSVFLLVAMTFAGAAVAARSNRHIRIELLEHYLPPAGRRVLYCLQWLMTIAVLALVVWYGAAFALQEYRWESLSPGLGLPNWWYVVWLPLLALAVALRTTQNLRQRLRALTAASTSEHRHEP